MADLLVIDDERSIRRSLELLLHSAGHTVHTAQTVAEGRQVWLEEKPDLVILDLMLPDGDGIDLLQSMSAEDVGGMVIIITGHHDLDKAVEAMRTGAFDYIHKPIDADELELAIERALSLLKERERLALISDLEVERRPEKIVGESRSMLELHKQLGLACRGRANVLILGESGTGKELVARAIHRNVTPDKPFVPINCSAIVPTLLESELFGHERGAFTGAVQRKLGRFELAGEGTVFLDEIADMETELQAKLLRALQEREFQRVGGSANIPFTARLVAATNRELASMIREGGFREDLYYRLRVVEIQIPPLRDRLGDIPLLVEHLLARINKELRRNVSKVPDESMNILTRYDWPGNVRELENLLMASVMRSPGDTLQLTAPAGVRLGSNDFAEPVAPESNQLPEHVRPWRRTLADVEREHIGLVLRKVEGHLGRACEILGITRPTLRKKISDFGLKQFIK